MRILIIADPVIPVPPSGYGGAERVVYSLARGIHEQGHQVKVMAGPGSHGDWPVIIHCAPDNSRWLSRAWRKLLFQATSAWCARSCDVVISVGRIDYLWALLRLHKPIVQLFMHPIEETVFKLLPYRRDSVRLVSMSNRHRRDVTRGHWSTVFIGVPVESFDWSQQDDGYLVFIGRFHPTKGAHIAIEVARKAGYPLRLAASPPRDEIERSYFDALVSRAV